MGGKTMFHEHTKKITIKTNLFSFFVEPRTYRLYLDEGDREEYVTFLQEGDDLNGSEKHCWCMMVGGTGETAYAPYESFTTCPFLDLAAECVPLGLSGDRDGAIRLIRDYKENFPYSL